MVDFEQHRIGDVTDSLGGEESTYLSEEDTRMFRSVSCSILIISTLTFLVSLVWDDARPYALVVLTVTGTLGLVVALTPKCCCCCI